MIMVEVSLASVVITAAMVGGLSGAFMMVVYDRSARKRALEEFKHKHKLND
jgi:hypothetical protein